MILFLTKGVLISHKINLYFIKEAIWYTSNAMIEKYHVPYKLYALSQNVQHKLLSK